MRKARKILITASIILVASVVFLVKYSDIYSTIYKTNHKFENSNKFYNGKIDEMEKGAYLVPFSPQYVGIKPKKYLSPATRVALYDDNGQLLDFESLLGSFELVNSSYSQQTGSYSFYSIVFNNNIDISRDGNIKRLFLPDNLEYRNKTWGVTNMLQTHENIIGLVNIGYVEDGYAMDIVKFQPDQPQSQIKKRVVNGYMLDGAYAKNKYFLHYDERNSETNLKPPQGIIVLDDQLNVKNIIDMQDYNLINDGQEYHTVISLSNGNILIYGKTNHDIEGTVSDVVLIDGEKENIIKNVNFPTKGDFSPRYVYEYDSNVYIIGFEGVIRKYDLDLNYVSEVRLEDKYGLWQSLIESIRTTGDKYIHVFYSNRDEQNSEFRPGKIIKYDITTGNLISYIELKKPVTYSIWGGEEYLGAASAFEIIRK